MCVKQDSCFCSNSVDQVHARMENDGMDALHWLPMDKVSNPQIPCTVLACLMHEPFSTKKKKQKAHNQP